MVCLVTSAGSVRLINYNILAPSRLDLLGGACGGGQALLGTWVLQAKLAAVLRLHFYSSLFFPFLLLTLSKLSSSEAFVTPGVALQSMIKRKTGMLETGGTRDRHSQGEKTEGKKKLEEPCD